MSRSALEGVEIHRHGADRSMRRWTVRAGDPPTIGALVMRATGDAEALQEGRVFVGTRRAIAHDEPVTVGDAVTIAPPRVAPKGMSIAGVEDDVVATIKPAGMPTIADQSGAAHTLVAHVAMALGVDPARLHPTSRLDRDVSGVVLFALTPAARKRLQDARATGDYVRRYVALAVRAPTPGAGEWSAPIGRAQDSRHRAVNGRDATYALTRYRTIAQANGVALLTLAPVTGRTHQLRVHASHAGAAFFGDRVYGGPTRVTLGSGEVLRIQRIALHAARISVPRCKRGESWVIDAPVPEEMAFVWCAVGGAAEDFATGVRATVTGTT